MSYRTPPGGRYGLRRAGLALTAVLALGMGAIASPALAATSPSPSTADPRTLPRDQRPAPLQPSVDVKGDHAGLRVRWHHTPANARDFTVTRTDAAGNKVILTEHPVAGQSYLDKTATAGETYSYTVTVSEVAKGGSAKQSGGR